MAESGPDAALLARLDRLEPREELVMRLALRERHDNIRGDRGFSDRIKSLLERLDPRPGEMAAILADAREAEKTMAPGPASNGDADAVPPRRKA